MYTGGLENHPQIIEQISAHRPLWGNSADVLRSVRDPIQVCELLRTTGLPTVETRVADNPPDQRGEWLLKPMNAAGGTGIVVWDEAATNHATLQRAHYFQRKLAGLPMSALFLAGPRWTHLIGCTRQFVGTKSLHARPFAYCGSLGPMPIGAMFREQVSRIGTVLAGGFELRGLFGIDLIFDGDVAVPVEVNPRYVASAEVLERACHLPLLRWHQQACDPYVQDSTDTEKEELLAGLLEHSTADCRRIEGKAILFAPTDIVWPEVSLLRECLSREGCLLADIPQTGTQIPRGRPVCTVLAGGKANETACSVWCVGCDLFARTHQ